MAWELDADRPIYAQLVERIQREIVSGQYRPGEKLPSVRDLATVAAVNPNTMQKAFAELERSGLIVTQRTSGRTVTEDTELIRNTREQLAVGHVRNFMNNMQELGYQKEEIKDFFDMELPIRRLEQSQAETAIFLGKVGVGISVENLNAGRFDQYDGIFLLLDDVDQFDGATIQLPETTCVDIRFRGSHPEAPEQYRKLLAYLAEHQLEAADLAREVTMIDYGITKDTGKFVTEISIPVRPKA